MTANAWVIYDEFRELCADGTMDLDADTFNLGLYLSTSNAATVTLSGRAALTNQVASAFGYTQPGQALDNVTWTKSGSTVTFTSDAEVFTASGGSITARFGVIDDDTVAAPVTDPLVCYSLLDNSPADVTATDGNTLTITMHANGIFTLT